ncbi:ferrochelatase [Sneathiella marina]|uniref:Ferrochelatase n=1 Tax=Sneathiella marina TaxID=2950108 RepID=A0ABY4W2I1_9PROT|nr:ferrochelatase [Sneathiella marina]USG61395.1 ferrochelatase [Sneathiella marina]
MARKAVVLFNLGGPDSLEAVQPFLYNLFMDPAIIRLPKPLRFLVAKLISSRRAPVAQEIYGHLGGSSPLLPQTEAQAAALKTALSDSNPVDEYEIFICMRYWHPLSAQTVQSVKSYGPDEIILVPLYPQYSSTTSASSLADWHGAAKSAQLEVPTATLCCYPLENGLISAYSTLIAEKIEGMDLSRTRILFSAHGLPQKIVDAGDPYQWQIEQTATGIVEKLARPELDWKICYQSRVGPLKWLQPSTDDEIAAAGAAGLSLVILPIAFVSEHSETLVELDIEYAELAKKSGVPHYKRVDTVGVSDDFIAGLADVVLRLTPGAVTSGQGGRICPGKFSDCALAS